MKRKDFDKALKELTEGGLLSATKMAAASDELKTQITHHLIRNREPVVLNLIPATVDWSWLRSMGYAYRERGVHFTFLCTSEQVYAIRRQHDLARAAPQPTPIPFTPGKGQLVGYYPGEGQYGDGTGYAEGRISYNAEAKAHFQKDALAFLRAVQKELGWATTGKKRGPEFNPSGIAGSGNATLALFPPGVEEGVYISIDADSGVMHRLHSRSGVLVMWRCCTRTSPYGGFGMHLENRFEQWDITAAALAAKIRTAHRKHTGQITDEELAAERRAS